MKKLYTIVGAVLITGLAFGQTPLREYGAAQAMNVKQASVNVTSIDGESASSRATYWSESFGSGGPGTTDLPTGWTNTVNAGPAGYPGWEFTLLGHTGAYPTSAITSTTAGDGWMIVDSDLHGTSGGGSSEDCIFDSPIIDLSATGTGPAYMLQFDQVFREYIVDITTIQVTTDGFASTTDFLINEGVGNVNPTPTTTVGLLIASAIAGGEATVQIRFWWQGDWDYGWQIDDIAIVDAPSDDLVMSTVYYHTTTPNTDLNGFYGQDINFTHRMYPTAHLDDATFFAASYNFGADTQTGVYATADDGGGIFATSASITQLTGSTDTLQIGDFNTPAVVGQYDFTLDLNYDDEANEGTPGDNMMSDSLYVTNGVFGSDYDFYSGYGYTFTDGADVGNTYEMRTNDMALAIEVVLRGDVLDGLVIFPRIYQYDAIAGNFVLAYDGQGFDEYTVVAATDLPTATGPNPVSIALPLSTPMALAAGETYLACVGHYGGGAESLIVATSGASEFGTTLLFDYAAAPGSEWGWLGSAPMVRLWMNGSPVVGVEEETSTINLSQNMPNPTNGFTTISYDLQSGAEASFQIVDITGKVVYAENYGNVSAGAHNIVLDVTEFAQGVYYYTLTAGDMSATKKMIITE